MLTVMTPAAYTVMPPSLSWTSTMTLTSDKPVTTHGANDPVQRDKTGMDALKIRVTVAVLVFRLHWAAIDVLKVQISDHLVKCFSFLWSVSRCIDIKSVNLNAFTYRRNVRCQIWSLGVIDPRICSIVYRD